MTRRTEEMPDAISGAAHELRTPLARLRNRLNLIARDPAAAPVRRQIEEAGAEADRLIQLFSALLRIAEVDSGVQRDDFVALDLAELAGECVEALDAVAEESGHLIEAPAAEPVRMRGDAQLLSQMIVNLVENALRHTPAGSRIVVSVAQDGPGMAVLTVADDGPGIAEADRARALERFGRGGAAGGAKGHGLGLALVASIARMHGGAVELGDAGPGLKVTVRLGSGL